MTKRENDKEYYGKLLKHTKTIFIFKLSRKYHKDYSERTEINLAFNSDRVGRHLALCLSLDVLLNKWMVKTFKFS